VSRDPHRRNPGGEGRLPPPPPPRWEVAPAPEPEEVRVLEDRLSLPRPLCALLAIRGLGDPDRAKAFLRPVLDALHPPDAMTDLSRAVERMATAVQKGETIFVHGDYDVDGMAGTALLTRWLRDLGATVVPFIPNRLRDGYDLGPSGVQAARAAGASVLVTVDCGILAHEAVASAVESGMDVIVTDHHTPGDTLPTALAVLNPNRRDCSYPNRDLCGAGVAFKLCQGLAEVFHRGAEELHPYLDLVGMATVADLVPLRGENRTLVRFGLRALERTRNPGLKALLRVSGLEGREVTAGAVGFVLAPRLNAIGRLGDPHTALRLLLTHDGKEAEVLAQEADALNRERQAADRSTLEEAISRLAMDFDPRRDYGVVLAGEGWHPGVIGIVASRLVEQIHRPTILVAMDGDRGRGSARSIPGFHILRAMEAGGGHLERFGGHKQAAGLDILREELPAFRQIFNGEARRLLAHEDLRPLLKVDLEVRLEDLTQDLFKFLKYMGPHGMANPRPLFLARGVRLAGRPRVAGKDHLKLQIHQDGSALDAIGFGLAGRIPANSLDGKSLDVVFQLQENEYRGRRSLQAGLKDVRVRDGAPR